ncbi:MAG: GNAT family N-acetyltransferase [Candidatus Edwardsbacteria bacterium]|nr:GNAT family N-acetyltransferase [Candidatus Edwardsbacteria bacterium]
MSDLPQWLKLRNALWPGALAMHRREMRKMLRDARNQPVWVAEAGNTLTGFLEVSVRNYAEGAGRTDVDYLEGWYVKPEYRKQGVGRGLVIEAEQWAVRRGFTHMASDTELDNEVSLKAHLAMGYREVERGIHFAKRLKSKGRR